MSRSPITEKALKRIQEQKEYAGKVKELAERFNAYSSSEAGKFNGLYLNKTDFETICKALENHETAIKQDIERQERALECGSESGDLRSHSEKNILQGCVRLLCEAGENFRAYLDYIGAEEDEEFLANSPMQYGHIVKHLFLWNTYHSGGTSTRAKCRELGVNFDDEVDIYETEEVEA